MKKLNLNIPEELHKRFKKHCVDLDKDMTTVLLQMIEDCLRKAEGKMKKQ